MYPRDIPGYEQVKQINEEKQGPPRKARRSRPSSAVIFQGSYVPERPPVSTVSIRTKKLQNAMSTAELRRSSSGKSPESDGSPYFLSGSFERDHEKEEEEEELKEYYHKSASPRTLTEEDLLSTAAGGLEKSSYGTWTGPGYGLLGPKAKTKVKSSSTRIIPSSYASIKERREFEQQALQQTLAMGGSEALKSSKVKDFRRDEGALERIPGKGKRKSKRQPLQESTTSSFPGDHDTDEFEFQPSLVERIGSKLSPGASVLSPRVYAAAIAGVPLGSSSKEAAASSLNHQGVMKKVKKLIDSRPAVLNAPPIYRPRDASSRNAATNIMNAMREAIYFYLNPSSQAMDFSFYSERPDIISEALAAAWTRRDCDDPLAPFHGLHRNNKSIYLETVPPEYDTAKSAADLVVTRKGNLCSTRAIKSTDVHYDGSGILYRLLFKLLPPDNDMSTILVDSSQIPLHW